MLLLLYVVTPALLLPSEIRARRLRTQAPLAQFVPHGPLSTRGGRSPPPPPPGVGRKRGETHRSDDGSVGGVGGANDDTERNSPANTVFALKPNTTCLFRVLDDTREVPGWH